MANSKLVGREFQIPTEVLKHLQATLNSYKGDKTVEGYKRLNNLVSKPSVTYYGIKRIKEFFDSNPDTNSIEYKLNGGDTFKAWVENTLSTSRNAVEDKGKLTKDIVNQINPNKTRDTSGVKQSRVSQSEKIIKDNSPVIYGESTNKKRIIRITESQLIRYLNQLTKDL